MPSQVERQEKRPIAQRRVWPGVRARAATRCDEVHASEPAIPHPGDLRFPTPIYGWEAFERRVGKRTGSFKLYANSCIGLIVVFATEKCYVFAGKPASNVRVVGVYLGTFRRNVSKRMRHRSARSSGFTAVCYRLHFFARWVWASTVLGPSHGLEVKAQP